MQFENSLKMYLTIKNFNLRVERNFLFFNLKIFSYLVEFSRNKTTKI